MIEGFTSAIATKAGSAVGDVITEKIKARVTDLAPAGVTESEIDMLTRRVRIKLAEIERAERAGDSTYKYGGAAVGAFLGFCLIWSVTKERGGSKEV